LDQWVGQYHNPLEPADRQGIPSNAGLEYFADRQRLRGHHSDHELINGCWLLKTSPWHKFALSFRLSGEQKAQSCDIA
jgi:hypothetical protein